MRSLTALLLTFLCAIALSAATYRVDGDKGDDANDGLAAPVKTIASVLKKLQPGDTLLLTKLDRPYRESIPLTVHGMPAAPIVVDGGGATISGADTAPKTGWVENAGVFSLAQATAVKFLFGPGCRYEMAAAPDKLKAEEWAWREGKLFFRPAAGKTPADYDLQMSVRISGIITTGAGQIIVRNLTAMHFYNDGFNIHSGTSPMWFENIRGLWNGDEGFSCHENVEAYVRGGEFSHNYWHGIADVGIARTHYQNIVCRDNRSKGVYLIGAMHSISDSEISGSPIQIMLSASDQQGLPRFDAMPLRTSLTNLRSVVVRSRPDEAGIVLTAGAAGVIEHCTILGGKTCLQVDKDASAYVINSIIARGETNEVAAAGTYTAESNLYFPGRLVIKETTYGPEQFAAYVAATDNDHASFVEEPKFIGNTLIVSKASHAAGGAFNRGGFGGSDIGIERRHPRPDEPGVQPAPPTAAQVAATGGTVKPGEKGEVLVYDFEAVHPWGLIYPEP
ncbi:MAG: right-handed parallel beta-helix repeat-containing protein, partial [Armatimonadetes bacterium]|nr:right-handed parallel beta-helix repeat-containing protein [Armatimonadota bacterium]